MTVREEEKMDLDSFFMAVILVGGLAVGFFGINIYRYCVVIMSGAGGFFLGKIACEKFFSNIAGEGVFRESNATSIDSFVIAVCVLVGIALGYFLYNIMGPLVGGVGAGFLFAKAAQVLVNADTVTMLVFAAIGVAVGAVLGALAVKCGSWPMIIFCALSGARLASYTGAFYLHSQSFATSIAKPVMRLFQDSPFDATRMAISLELFVVLAILGTVVQAIVRDD